MTAREEHLKQLKALQSRTEYFESLYQIFDQLIDIFPLYRNMWMRSSDWRALTKQLEHDYNKNELT